MMTSKESLAQLVEPLNKQFAEMIRSDQAKVEQIPTPFLQAGEIHRVTRLLPTRPIVFTVGHAGDFTVLLAGNPDGYLQLARKAQLRLDTDANRLAYLITFLETTRSFAHRFQILRDASEIKARPGLSEEAAGSFARKMEGYRSAIRPPEITGNGPWKATVFAVRGQGLVQIDLTLSSDGGISTKETVLEENLPIPYAL